MLVEPIAKVKKNFEFLKTNLFPVSSFSWIDYLFLRSTVHSFISKYGSTSFWLLFSFSFGVSVFSVGLESFSDSEVLLIKFFSSLFSWQQNDIIVFWLHDIQVSRYTYQLPGYTGFKVYLDTQGSRYTWIHRVQGIPGYTGSR